MDFEKELLEGFRIMQKDLKAHSEKSEQRHIESIKELNKIDKRVTKIETRGAAIAIVLSTFIASGVKWLTFFNKD